MLFLSVSWIVIQLQDYNVYVNFISVNCNWNRCKTLIYKLVYLLSFVMFSYCSLAKQTLSFRIMEHVQNISFKYYFLTFYFDDY